MTNESFTQSMMDVFHHLHANPEVSGEELRTTAYLTDHLNQMGLRITLYPNEPGAVAEWGPEQGPVVALRADMDALWQEVDGVWKANHSCGHDAHMTMVLGALMMLKDKFPHPDVRIRAIFQPSEETGEGARWMVDRGALRDVGFLFGVHLRPIQELPYGKLSAAIRNGAALHLHGIIQGQSAHGARPHLGVNPIEVAFAVMNAATSVHVDPMIPHSVKMTVLHAGGKSANVIPDRAEFSLDLRAQTNDAMGALATSVESRIQATCALYGADVALRRSGLTIAAEVGDRARGLMEQAILNCHHETALAPDVVTPGAEDFHYYTKSKPELQATMLGLGCDLTPGLHHPHMTFRHDALIDGMVVLAEAVELAMAQLASNEVVRSTV